MEGFLLAIDFQYQVVTTCVGLQEEYSDLPLQCTPKLQTMPLATSPYLALERSASDGACLADNRRVSSIPAFSPLPAASTHSEFPVTKATRCATHSDCTQWNPTDYCGPEQTCRKADDTVRGSFLAITARGRTLHLPVTGTLGYTGGDAYTYPPDPDILNDVRSAAVHHIALFGEGEVHQGPVHVKDTYISLEGKLEGRVSRASDEEAWATVNSTSESMFAVTGAFVYENKIMFEPGKMNHPVAFWRNYATREFMLSAPMFGDGFTARLTLKGIAGNQSPVILAGSNQAIHCSSNDGAIVQLEGTFIDPDDDHSPYRVMWYERKDSGFTVLSTELTPTLTMPIGTHHLTLYGEDGSGGASYATVTIDVVEPCI
jgi:hypothetical protein